MTTKPQQSGGRRENEAVRAWEMTKGVGAKGPGAYPTGQHDPGNSAQRSKNRKTKED